jgi:hypothetical protein
MDGGGGGVTLEDHEGLLVQTEQPVTIPVAVRSNYANCHNATFSSALPAQCTQLT